MCSIETTNPAWLSMCSWQHLLNESAGKCASDPLWGVEGDTSNSSCLWAPSPGRARVFWLDLVWTVGHLVFFLISYCFNILQSWIASGAMGVVWCDMMSVYLKILWDRVCGGAWANLLQVLLEPPLCFWFSWACPTQSSRLVCCVERAESNRSSGGWQCFQKAEPGKWDKGAKSVSLFRFQIVLSSIWICTCCASEKVWWCCCTPFQDWSVGFNCLHHSFSGIFAISCGWQAAQQIYVLWTHQTRFVLGKDLISQTCMSCHVMSIKEPIQPTDKPTTYYFNQSMIEW